MDEKKNVSCIYLLLNFRIFSTKNESVSEGPYSVRKIDFVKIREKERIWIQKTWRAYIFVEFPIFSIKNEKKKIRCVHISAVQIPNIPYQK